jgi:hypothetical protein
MEITVQLPDDLAQHTNPAREALESLVLEGVRSGKLNRKEARILLGFDTPMELDSFLKAHQVWTLAYGIKEFEEDIETIRRMDHGPQEQRRG